MFQSSLLLEVNREGILGYSSDVWKGTGKYSNFVLTILDQRGMFCKMFLSQLRLEDLQAYINV